MRIGIVINPISGSTGHLAETVTQRMAHARRLIDRPNLEAEIVTTMGRGHAVELSRQFVERGFDVVMAWGGDGTVNEVAGPLIGSRTALGVIPSGSGDGLARSLGLERKPDVAFADALSGQVRAVDVGYLGDRHFLNVAGVGFDAAVADHFNRGRRRGALGYLIRVPTMLWGYTPKAYEVQFDGRDASGVHLLVAFANGREYGNHMMLAPHANPHDGWLDAVIVSGGSPWRQLWRARRLAFSPDRPAAGISRTRVKTAVVAGAALMCQVDGETFEASGRVDVRIAPAALRVCGLRS